MSDFLAPQPAPSNKDAQSVWALVIADIERTRDDGYPHTDLLLEECRKRNAFGIAKHGVPLTVSNGRDPAADAYQEALDGMVYWCQEAERTKDPAADYVYRVSIRLAKLARDYLYRRDGR